MVAEQWHRSSTDLPLTLSTRMNDDDDRPFLARNAGLNKAGRWPIICKQGRCANALSGATTHSRESLRKGVAIIVTLRRAEPIVRHEPSCQYWVQGTKWVPVDLRCTLGIKH